MVVVVLKQPRRKGGHFCDGQQHECARKDDPPKAVLQPCSTGTGRSMDKALKGTQMRLLKHGEVPEWSIKDA